MAPYKKYISVVAISICASSAWPLDDSSLWLPKRYQKWYIPLVNSAFAAEAIDRCVTVLDGTVDLEQSTPDHPIFRILCRQENGVSYNEMVDGLTYETLTTPKIIEPILTEEEKEALRLAEEARAAAELERKKQDFWLQCDLALKARTKLMQDLQWLTKMPPEPVQLTTDAAEFVVDFDAKNMWNKDLLYQARCNASVTAPVVVVVKKRPN